jgi:peptidoglycan/LPS O-acetylase OafA/YrhL
MNEVLTIVFYLIFFLSLHKAQGKEYLSKDTSLNLKGWFSVAVMFHHLAQRTHDGLFFHHFLFTGIFSVSCFLFYSGYGLMKNCMNRKDYEKHWFRKRIMPVLLPFAFYNCLLWAVNLFEGKFIGIREMLRGLSKGEPMAIFSWYVWYILLFYIAFWILMKTVNKHPRKMIIGAFIFNILYVVFCMIMNFGIWWYNTGHFIVSGMVYAAYEDKCEGWLKKHGKLLSAVMIPVVLTASWLPYLLPFAFQLPVYIALSVSFVILMILVSMKHVPDSKILRFFGSISYELYLLHELPLMMLRGTHIYIQNDSLWVLSVLVCTVLLAYGYHLLFASVTKRLKMLSEK